MFAHRKDGGYTEILDGIQIKTLVYGEKTLMTEFRLKGGKVLPMHAHPYEQTGFMVSGRLRLTIGDSVFDAGPGESWMIPENVSHGAEVIEDTVAIEVFSPVRKDYLAYFRGGD